GSEVVVCERAQDPPRPDHAIVADRHGSKDALAADAVEAEDLSKSPIAPAAVVRAFRNRHILHHCARADAEADIEPVPVGANRLGAPDTARRGQAFRRCLSRGEDEDGRNAQDQSLHMLESYSLNATAPASSLEACCSPLERRGSLPRR